MEKGNWNLIRIHLKRVLEEIFQNYNFQNLSNYEKRKIIFEFLCNNLSYDYELFNSIKDFHDGKKRFLEIRI